MAAGEHGEQQDSEGQDNLIPTSISLPQSAREALEQLARINRRTFAAEVRVALRAHLARYGKGEALPEVHERARAREREL